jgi:hypothetical protein
MVGRDRVIFQVVIDFLFHIDQTIGGISELDSLTFKDAADLRRFLWCIKGLVQDFSCVASTTGPIGGKPISENRLSFSF